MPVVQVADQLALVETTAGTVRGLIRNGIYTYKGIPYGASTAGSNRFLPPKKPEAWSGVRNALFWGPSSAHPFMSPEMANDFSAFSNLFTFHFNNFYTGENCLTINVWTPAINDAKKRPVLVWLHGGGYEFGSSMNMDGYIGENLSARGDVVVCSVSHRVGCFGFLDLSEVGGGAFRDSANLSQQDLIYALEWVRDNIGSFGGDANNVTLFGQSGGGAKASVLMAMPKARGLFHKVMTMSGVSLRVDTQNDANKIAQAVLEEAGLEADRLQRLQEMSWEDCYRIINAAKRKLLIKEGILFSEPYLHWSPHVDGTHLPQHPFDPVAPALSQGMPMLIGSTMNENSPSAHEPALEGIDLAGVCDKLQATYPGHASEIVEAYVRAFPRRKPIEILSMILSPRTQQVRQAQRQTLNGGKVYCYWFGWQTPLYDARPRSYHSSDIPFWFDNTDVMDTMTGGGERPKALAAKMSEALLQFAQSGDPNHPGLPDWPAYSAEQGEIMILDDACEAQADPDGPARKLIEALRA